MSDRIVPGRESQSAGAVLMVRPANFGFNPQTAASNAFQNPMESAVAPDVQLRALLEFDALAAALARAGVRVIVVDDSAAPLKPDAVFPNNWVSFHHDGSVVLYPMMAPNRRLERRADIIETVVRDAPFLRTRSVDLTHHEAQQRFLEGTGSVVLDRPQRIAYAGRSPRTDSAVLAEFAAELGYDVVSFDTVDPAGNAIYHTNVVMAVAQHFAVLCTEALTTAAERHRVCERLEAGGHRIVEISALQMLEFAGNVLELAPRAGPVLALSTTAWRAFDAAQRRTLERFAAVLPVEIPVIERCGGGGVRCMLAEIPLAPMPRPAPATVR